MARKFDRFMVTNANGRNRRLAKFTDAEFRALVQGIWPIASEATPRGAFMVDGAPATAADVVWMAPKVRLKSAQAAIKKMRELGMLEHDDELGGEWVHDWDVLNPSPKTDRTNAKRQAEWRARNAESNATRNGVTNTTNNAPLKVEGEVEDPPSPPDGGKVSVKFNGKTVPNERLQVARSVLSDFNQREGTTYAETTGSGKLSEPFKRILGALIDRPHVGAELAVRVNEVCLTGERFWEGVAQPGNVWGPGVVDRNVAKALGARPGQDAVHLKLLEGPRGPSEKLRAALDAEGIA